MVPVTRALRTPDAVTCTGLSVGLHRPAPGRPAPGRPLLAGLDLAVAPGETIALLGSSGSGKTTLLNAIAGFVTPLAGEIWLAGHVASAPGRCLAPERRRIGMVFQDHALWPHLSVLDTVAYPLRRAGASKTAARRGAQVILEQLNLGPLAERRPGQLSGGEQQRVGLARALACQPAVYLFDEPTAHLDAGLRGQILEEVARRRAADGAAALYATHDAAEALAIADRVAVLHSGRMAQVATPAGVYAEPDDLTVARLTGPVSVLYAPVSAAAAGKATIGVGQARATVLCSTAPGAVPAAPGTVSAVPESVSAVPAEAGTGSAAQVAAPAVLVRPDWARLGGPDLGGRDHDGDLPGAITEIRFRGPHTDYHLDTPAGTLLIREAGPPRAERGPVRWSLLRARLMPHEHRG